MKEINQWVRDELGFDSPEDFDRLKLLNHLNRPIRVCGWLKIKGNPGRPFWTGKDEEMSLQIVESPQVDFSASDQKQIFEKATHFNPVDIVCGVKNYKKEKFDLLKFRDLSAGIITQKSQGEEILKLRSCLDYGMVRWHIGTQFLWKFHHKRLVQSRPSMIYLNPLINNFKLIAIIEFCVEG